MSYVLTSSNDFDETVRHIIKGLNSAGFSDKDYRLSAPPAPAPAQQTPVQMEISQAAPLKTDEPDNFAEVDSQTIRDELERRREQEKTAENTPKADTMLEAAKQAGAAYDDARKAANNDPYTDNLPWEVRDKVTTFEVNPQYREDIETLAIPQFFQVIPNTLFTEGSLELLEKEQLGAGKSGRFAQGIQNEQRRPAVF